MSPPPPPPNRIPSDEPRRFWGDLPPGSGVPIGERVLYVALCGAVFAAGVAVGLTLFGAR